MPYGESPNKMGHSPAGMGHSPLEGHCGPLKMESAKQEKYNLMHDNPVAKHASGGSWMSKHSNSALHFNKPEHNHTHAGGDKNANTPHGGNVRTSGNTSKKDLAKLTQKNRARDARETQQARMAKKLKDKENNQSPAEMGHSPLEKHKAGHTEPTTMQKFRNFVEPGLSKNQSGNSRQQMFDYDGDGDTMFNDSNRDGTMLGRALKGSAQTFADAHIGAVKGFADGIKNLFSK